MVYLSTSFVYLILRYCYTHHFCDLLYCVLLSAGNDLKIYRSNNCFDSKSDSVLYLKWLPGPQKSNFFFMDRFEYFFSLTWKFDGDSKFDIVLYLKWLSGPKKSNFLVYGPIWIFFLLWLGNSMGIPNPFCTLPQMTHCTTKVGNNDSL